MELPPGSARPGSARPGAARKSASLQAPLSGELEALLVEAEQRIGGQLAHESMLPSPEEEIEAVLPADVLASLDEPVDDDDEDDRSLPPTTSRSAHHHKENTTGAGEGDDRRGQPRGDGRGNAPPSAHVCGTWGAERELTPPCAEDARRNERGRDRCFDDGASRRE